MRYVNKCPTKTLHIYGVPQKSLREFSQDNRRYGFVNLPPEDSRMRDEEIDGSAEVDQSQPVDAEAEMNEMFNQSILEGSEGVGRLSITNQSSSTDATLDFDSASVSSNATNKTNAMK